MLRCHATEPFNEKYASPRFGQGEERQIHYKHASTHAWCRERSDGLYKSVTYLVAKIVEEVIVALVQSLIMSCIVFFPLELAGSWALFWYTYFQTTVIGICAPLPPLPPKAAFS